jgi:hypothetical protein
MAEHDYVIANGTGAAVRADINSALAAIASNNSKATDPSTTYAYQWYVDTGDNTLYIRNSANNAWVAVSAVGGIGSANLGLMSAAGGTFTGDVVWDNATNSGKDLTWDESDNALEFKDDVKATFGDGADLSVEHDGSNAYVKNGTGDIIFQHGAENLMLLKDDGEVELYYDNVKEIATKSGGVKLFGHSESIVTALTSAASLTIDFSLSNHFSCTMGHNITFNNPTTESIGQSGTIVLTQDGTGSRTASWGTQFLWVGGTAPTLSTAAGAVDRIDYVVVAADKIHCVASLALD